MVHGGVGISGGGGVADLHRLAEGGVPAVLDGVIGPAVEVTRDGGPLVAVHALLLDDARVLLGREGPAVQLRRQVLAPPQPARLGAAPGHRARDRRPVLASVLPHRRPQRLVLIGAPRRLLAVRLALAALRRHERVRA